MYGNNYTPDQFESFDVFAFFLTAFCQGIFKLEYRQNCYLDQMLQNAVSQQYLHFLTR